MGMNHYGSWAPYVSVAQKKQQATQRAAALKKKGKPCQPVTIEGRAIASSFWGKAWCDNLESWSDIDNRLPRGRSYVRHGAVIDLRIETGAIQAMVSGSDIYNVQIDVQPLTAKTWNAIVKACSGKVASLIELLQGRLSRAVMETVTRRRDGLFPLSHEIRLRCDCPDAASMCKHVAAVLYGVGARLDNEPELLFRLRHVDPQALMGQLGNLPVPEQAGAQHGLGETDLSALFGIDLGDASDASPVLSTQGAPPSGKRLRGSKVIAPTQAAKTRKTATPRRERSKTCTAGELMARGVVRHMIQSWISSGVLIRTDQRGVYRTTAQTEARIVAYVARRADRRRLARSTATRGAVK
jgi:uncharacterized Zn finger protein